MGTSNGDVWRKAAHANRYEQDSCFNLYTAGTPNGQKAAIMLEETGLPHRSYILDLRRGEQKTAECLAIDPNAKIPAIVDRDGFGQGPAPVFGSGAVRSYRTQKPRPLPPAEPAARITTLSWLVFQLAGIGPMFGQAGHWTRAGTASQQAAERYHNEAIRLLGVLKTRLSASACLRGPQRHHRRCRPLAVGERLRVLRPASLGDALCRALSGDGPQAPISLPWPCLIPGRALPRARLAPAPLEAGVLCWSERWPIS